MSIADAVTSESRTFEADVSKLLHLMAHSVYSDREVFLRESPPTSPKSFTPHRIFGCSALMRSRLKQTSPR